MGSVNQELFAKNFVGLLQRTTPFQAVPEHLLKAIASVARLQSFDEGDVIYEVGEIASDLFIITSGSVELRFSRTERAKTTNKVLREGEIFGWAALYRVQGSQATARVASAVAKEKLVVMDIDTNELADVFQLDRAAYAVMMQHLAAVVAREYAIPETWGDGSIDRS